MKLVRKLILSLVSLSLLIVTFCTTTFAWFKINEQANLSGFEFKATGGMGFLISVDGENYSNDLTSEQIMASIIRGYNPGAYTIENNKLMQVGEDGNTPVSSEYVKNLLKETLLLTPVTSNDGMNFSNLSGSSLNSTSGKLIEFDLYFKATSPNKDDGMGYDIYLCGNDVELTNGTKVEKTQIKSTQSDTIPLQTQMTTMKGTTPTILGPTEATDDKKSVTVNTSNALRLSIQDTTLATPNATIYELTDELDLGSYATDYNKEATSNFTESDRLYNSNYNAMFTYYNKLRPYSKLTPMSYTNKPETVRTLSDSTIITNVKSGYDAKKVTFRIWLEGWDADCFDGISQAINVRLLFNSVDKSTYQPWE